MISCAYAHKLPTHVLCSTQEQQSKLEPLKTNFTFAREAIKGELTSRFQYALNQKKQRIRALDDALERWERDEDDAMSAQASDSDEPAEFQDDHLRGRSSLRAKPTPLKVPSGRISSGMRSKAGEPAPITEDDLLDDLLS